MEYICWWLQKERWAFGVPLKVSHPALLLYTNASLTDWGTHPLKLAVAGVWSLKCREFYIKVLEMKLVILALNALLDRLEGESVILMSNNTTVMAYLKKQGGTISKVLCSLAQGEMMWVAVHSVTFIARYVYIPGKKNVLADQVSHQDQDLPTEWSLLPLVFDTICEVFGRPHLDFFIMRANAKLPLYVSLVPEPMAWKQDTFHHPGDVKPPPPPFTLLCQVLSRVMLATRLSLVLVAPF